MRTLRSTRAGCCHEANNLHGVGIVLTRNARLRDAIEIMDKEVRKIRRKNTERGLEDREGIRLEV